jgi:signal transduction histidine kinase
VTVRRRVRVPDRPGLTGVDATIAAAMVVLGCVELAAAAARTGPLLPELAAAALMGAAVFWRRRAPALAALVIAAAFTAEIWLVDGGDIGAASRGDNGVSLSTPALCVVLVAYGAGRYTRDRRPALRALGALAATMALVAVLSGRAGWGEYVFPMLIVLLVWLAGRAVLGPTLLAAQLHEEVAQAREDHDRNAERAIAEERRRLAREMHDVVAHSISVMVVQAGGARWIMDRDVERASDAAALVEQTGREALGELRLMLGMMHPASGGAGVLTPPPDLAAMPRLIARSQQAGVVTELQQHGSPVALGAAVELSAYRVVQEALTNTLKHAGVGAAAVVSMRWTPMALELEICDSGPVEDGNGAHRPAPQIPDGGHGLVGMAERLRLLDGTLDTRPVADGGFLVRARIPITTEGIE